MRQIATVADEDAARTFVDYLLTKKINSQVGEDPVGFAVWICDEDQVEQARQEWAEYTRDPTDARYRAATQQARELRKQEAREDKAYARRQHDLESEMAHAGTGGRPAVTLVLLLLSVTVTLLTNFGKLEGSELLTKLFIAPVTIEGQGGLWYPQLGLQAIYHGEVWRLITPIFIHLSPIHLIFNMLMLVQLGRSVEARAGKLKYLLMVLVIAAVSNVAEYYVSFSFDHQPWLSFTPSPFFGGMSGVLYGLFGFAWMKSRFDPEYGLNMSRENVLILMGWLVICLFGAVGPVANIAHGAGLLVGLALGYAPRLWRRWR